MQWFIDNRPEFRESLQKFHYFLRDSFKVPFPTTAGPMMLARPQAPAAARLTAGS